MSKVVIMADSNSGITQEDAKSRGIEVIPMPFLVDEKEYFEGVNLTQEQFYDMLARGADVSTSQPAPGALMDRWHSLLKQYDEIVYIPMSSGLSQSYQSAQLFAADFDGRVHVVDNHRISVTQKQAVYRAKKLADQGLSGAEIKAALLKEAFDSTIYITVDDLQYLKKGGRLTPAVAAIGTLLNLKPVLKILGYKLDVHTKTRGMKAARKAMIKAALADAEGALAPLVRENRLQVCIAYTQAPKEVIDSWVAEVQEAFPGKRILVDPLTLSISCHIGPGALAIALCETE
ncbi:MAG: DegV family protein [Clostridia bacterium]|nr:DegV family protein [Clostridia bacterium]